MIHVNNFHVCGISFKTANLDIRSHYALSPDQHKALLAILREHNVPGMILTTCNRSEVYFFSENPGLIEAHFAKMSTGSVTELDELGYLQSGKDAIQHLHRVSTGLESQILGDFEIIGQIKKAFVEAQQNGTSHGLLERIINGAIHVSRRAKNETQLSSGSSSVSYACVRYLRDHIPDLHTKNILLYGLGKIGRITLDNLIKHAKGNTISVTNRSEDKVADLRNREGIKVVDNTSLTEALHQYEVIIVATGATRPIIFAEHLAGDRPVWVLDMSVPNNVSPDVREMQNAHLVDVDQLSAAVEDSMALRKKEIPAVEHILEQEMSAFFDWYHRKELAQLSTYIEQSLRTITRETLQANGVNGQVEPITDEIATRHRKVMFDHLRQFFAAPGAHH